MKILLICLALLASSSILALEKIGEGIRQKKIAFFNIDVYHASLLVHDKILWNNNVSSNLEKLMQQKAVEFQMKMLRSVDQQKIKDSFVDAFETNQFNLNHPGIKQFFHHLEKIKEVKEKEKFVFKSIALNDVEVFFPDGKSERLIFDDMRKIIFSIWFGIPADDGIQKMSVAITGK
jgi:hypothetical protein